MTDEINAKLDKAVALETGKRHPAKLDKSIIVEEALQAWLKKNRY